MTEPRGRGLRILTANLYNGRARPDALRALIGRFTPDVVVAQEVGHDAATTLRTLYRYGEARGGINTDGRAMVANRPIELSELDLPFRGGFVATVPVDDVTVDLYGVHLANPIDHRSGPLVRRRQLAALERHLGDRGRVVLVGDLNATTAWPAHRRLSRALVDGVDVWAKENDVRPVPTWSPRRFPRPLLRIDHVMVRGMRVTECHTVAVPGSDHAAVIVDVEPVLP